MFIGVPKEIKSDEYRVGLIPATISELVSRGHDVGVEARAGDGAGISDDEYTAAGARIFPTADQIFERAELIVKVKEPLASERIKLRRGQMIFTYLHLAADIKQTHDLLASGVTAISYETVTDAAGRLPLLAPMSKVAGRMAPQVAAHFLERPYGGRGILLGGIEGMPSANHHSWWRGRGIQRDINRDRHGCRRYDRRAKPQDVKSFLAALWRTR